MKSPQHDTTNRHRLSLPSHLLWRSVLGAPAAWSGSSSRGIYLLDQSAANSNNQSNGNSDGSGMIQTIASDRRMFHLPTSLRDAIVGHNNLPRHPSINNYNDGPAHPSIPTDPPPPSKKMELLSHPRIVSAGSSSSHRSHSLRTFSRFNHGISCMDLDRGNDGTTAFGSPSRYLLVGSAGADCGISLYDLSYFGSDHYLYQQPSSKVSSNTNYSQYLPNTKSNNNPQSKVTHRPIARSLRHANSSDKEENASGVPSGHRHPLLNVHWYPGDVYGSFVSTSISGEILVWDAQNFVPVFATYAHVYQNNDGNALQRGDPTKAVAPLQCADLPKSPGGCPHGTALLALGLGSNAAGGRGVVQLCDAFRGGSATHELIGHGAAAGGGGSDIGMSSAEGGGGGVNALAWDPSHPFRLASAGDDGTVRLWDIRKAGSAACLGVLDREKEVGSLHCGDAYHEWTAMHPRKKQRAGLVSSSSRSIVQGIESHGGPVAALAFAPGGDDLVSAGLDGSLHHWDLRPESCYVSSISSIGGMYNNQRGRAKRDVEHGGGGGGMDPSVATGGRFVPSHFGVGGRMVKPVDALSAPDTKSARQRRRSLRRSRTSLAILQPGSRSTATLLSTANNGGRSSKGQIAGYSLYGRHGNEAGGHPEFVLNGHLDDVTCLVTMDKPWDNLRVEGTLDDATAGSHVHFLTGARDGMVLSWGNNNTHRNDDIRSWRSRRYGDDSDLSRPQLIHEEPSPLEDKDSW